MKAISIQQPWIHAIFREGKDIENRSWQRSFRGWVAIHASRIANLPESLRSHFKDWIEPGDMNGKVPFRFIVAGASDTSALVAFEEFGYVPSTHAISYVHVNDDWVAARTWNAVCYPTSLTELTNTISQLEVPVSGR
jgi:hypothetical protein